MRGTRANGTRPLGELSAACSAYPAYILQALARQFPVGGPCGGLQYRHALGAIAGLHRAGAQAVYHTDRETLLATAWPA